MATELGKAAAAFLTHDDDPALRKRKAPIYLNSGDGGSSDEYELDLDGWKANLSQADKDRLRHWCPYDPFAAKR